MPYRKFSEMLGNGVRTTALPKAPNSPKTEPPAPATPKTLDVLGDLGDEHPQSEIPKAPSSDAPANPAFWRELYEKRAAIRQFDGNHSRDEAESLAWGELQNRWHMARGERVSRELCAGCRRPIGHAEALDMIDGNRVHLAILDCLIRHGERWRRAATAALVGMGLKRPPEHGDTIG